MEISEKSEARILADVFKDVRNLTKYYLNKLSDVDPHFTYTGNGTSLNSIYWLTGHIIWAENFLVLKGLHGAPYDISWLEEFRLGARHYTSWENMPSYEELLQLMDKIHFSSLKHILTLTEADLDRRNAVELSFGKDDFSCRALLHHAIRHEPCHAGHLGWICKMNGIQTI